MSDVQLHQTHGFNMCHHYDKSNVIVKMNLVQLNTSQEEEYAYMMP